MRQTKLPSFGNLKKFYIRSLVSYFLFIMLYFMLDGLILFCKGDFRGIRCSLGWFLKAEF